MTEDGGEAGPDDAKYGARGRAHYMYDLAGVVVHTGTAESGHYYSLIRERDDRDDRDHRDDCDDCDDPPRPHGGAGSGGWFEFNDSSVKIFDFRGMTRECFGGAGDDACDLNFHDHLLSKVAERRAMEPPGAEQGRGVFWTAPFLVHQPLSLRHSGWER